MGTYGSTEEDIKAYLGEHVADFDVDGVITDIRAAGVTDIDAMDGDDFVSIIQAHDESGRPSSLAVLRTDAGMTQVELAERVGVGQSQIADWERGRNVPSVQSCVRLALALGVDAGVVVASAMQSDR